MNRCSYVGGINMERIAVCEEKHHHDIVETVKDKLPSEEVLYDLADLFKVFGDFTRIKILCALFEHEMCVCDIAEALKMNQSAVSHQLKILKNAKLIKNRKEGKQVFYSLADDHVRTILAMGLEHIEEQ